MLSSAEDEREIVALVNRYAFALDSADWALLRTCWADEIDADYRTGTTWTDADAFNEYMERYHTGLITMHMNGNHVFDDVGPGKAKGRTYYKAVLLRGDRSRLLRADGWYDDEFGKVNDQWKITRRYVRIIDFEQFSS